MKGNIMSDPNTAPQKEEPMETDTGHGDPPKPE